MDADPRSLRVLEVSLRKAGYNLATAGDGQIALSMIASSTPDLIVSDTRLPGLDGFALVESLRRNPDWASIPFMFLSSDPSVESKVKGLQLGVEDYLTKPIYIKEIVARINITLSRFERDSYARRSSISKTRFTGSLADMGLVDLLQTIEISRKSGVLEVHSGSRTGLMTFRDGQILDAELGTLHGERALYRVLLFSEGDFEIDFRPIKSEQQIHVPTQALLMEGMRRLDEWGRLLEQIPPLSSVMEINEEELAVRLAELPDEINSILRHVDGQRALEEVIDLVEGDDIATLGALSKLFFEGIMQPTGRSRTLRPAGPASADGGDDHEELESGMIPAGTLPPPPLVPSELDRANSDDPAATVPARASPPPAADAADEPLAAPAVSLDPPEEAAISAEAPPSPDPIAEEGTISADAVAKSLAKTTLIGPGFDAVRASTDDAGLEEAGLEEAGLEEAGLELGTREGAVPSDAEAEADVEDAMAKKNKKKNRGANVGQETAKQAAVVERPPVAEKVDAAVEAKKADDAQSNVIQFPAKRSGVATQVAVNDDVQSARVDAAEARGGESRTDDTSPRLRQDGKEEDTTGAPRLLPGELPKVIIDEDARASRPAPSPAAASAPASKRDERRKKKTSTTTSGEIRALGTGEHAAVTDDFFRTSQRPSAPEADDFSDLAPLPDTLPTGGRQWMFATIGIVVVAGGLIGGYWYYQQHVLPQPVELGHGGPVELPRIAATHTAEPTPPAPEVAVAEPVVVPSEGVAVEVDPSVDVAPEVAVAPEVVPEVAPEVVPEVVPEPALAGETYETALAAAESARRRPSTAIPLYEHAVGLNPMGSEALAQLSFLLLNRGHRADLEQARDYAQRASSVDATNSLAWLVLGAARDSLNDRAGALAAYRSCVEEGQGAHVRECRALAH